MKVDEVAQCLNISPKTVRNWVYKGKIPYLKVNGVVRFEISVIEKWITEGRNGNNEVAQ
jgi:excisionase family DNA binding protein